MKYCLLVVMVLAEVSLRAQAPVINTVVPNSAAPQQSIVITGNGFSSTSSQLSVWFDHVQGTVISSSAFSIQVQVPPQARYSNVEVINLVNNLGSKSAIKFQPSFGGASFDATKLSTPFTNADVTELFDIASSDFDLDGKPDLLASKTTGTNTGVAATDMVIYQNQSSGIGNINFSKFNQANLAALNVTAATANVAAGDLNGDGKPDIVAARTGANLNEVFILQNTNSVAGVLSFASVKKVFLSAGQSAARISIRDLNQDGKPELIVSNSFDDLNPATDNQIFIFPNQSSVSTITFGSPIILTVTGASSTYGLDVQDFDGDMKPDIIVFQYQTNNIFSFLNQSSGSISFAAPKQIAVSGSFNTVTSADLNQDGRLDLVVTATLDNAIQIFANNSTTGNISFGTPQVLTTSLGPWGVDANDIDGDGDVDIVVANRNEAKVNVFRQDASLSFTRLDIATSKPCFNVRVGDYDGDGKPDIAVTSFSNPNFSVDVIRNANCVSPAITSSSSIICTGQTIRLKTKPALGVSFNWVKDGVSVQTSALEYYDATAAGTYTVTANGTVDAACAVMSPQFILTSNPAAPPADPAIINNTPCLGSALNLSTPSVASATYQWTGPNNFSSTLQNPTITPVTSGEAGVYSLQITVGQCSSNVVTKQLDVASVPVLPVTASPSTTGCVGSTITLNVTNSANYSYQWKNSGAAIGGQTTSSLSVTAEGNYSVVVTDNTTSCSQETAQLPITLYTVPVPGFTFTTTDCPGVAINFTNQTTGDARGTLLYSWNFGDTQTSTVQNPVNTYASAATYSVTLTVSYSGVPGCSALLTKPITINAPVVPNIIAGANPICPGDKTSLSIASGFVSIAWVGVVGSTATVSITQPGMYSVNTTDNNGCTSSGTITINSNPQFTFQVSPDTTIKLGSIAKLRATGADSYVWSPGTSLSDSTSANPLAKPVQTTTYFVVATKAGFCHSIDSVKVTVEAGGKFINPPALFSPNGDSFNDTWKIPDTENYPDCIMTIYDGGGRQVYQQKGYNSVNYWDGNYNGKAVPDGTYFYVFGCPTGQVTTGSVLVAR